MSKTICLDVSVLADENKTGIGIYTYELIKAILKINKKDKFILFGITTYKNYKLLKNIEFKDNPNVILKIYRLPLIFFRRFFLLWQKINWPKVEKLVGRVDICHSFNWYLLPQKTGKSLATVFDMTPVLFPGLHQKKTLQMDKVRLNRIKKYADLVITISKNSKKDFLKFAPGKKTAVIYPGISEVFLNPIEKEKMKIILKKYHLNLPYILSVGTIEPRKNLERLIKAFASLATQGQTLCGYELLMVGARGWMSDGIFALPKKLGIEDRVKFLGRVEEEDLPYLYNNSFCFLYPSLYEGFGIPILESQASSCPVITSSVSSLPEVGGKSVLYVNPNSVEDIVRGIKEVEKFRKQLIEEGHKNLKRFSWKASAKKLNLLYQRL